MACRSWATTASASKPPPLLCAHGINQNSRHFGALAGRLAGDFDLLAPDYPGRGLSDPFSNKLNYGFDIYRQVFLSFLAAKGLDNLYWLGTSMGGVTGLMVASLPDSPIRKLVLNDIGPVVPKQTRQLAVTAAKRGVVRHASFAEAVESMSGYLVNFGITSQAMREEYVRASVRPLADGSWAPDFDPDIYYPSLVYAERANEDYPLWNYWQTVRCPVLVLHGVNSIALTPEIIARMRETRPDIEVIDIPATGHAPHLMDEHQARLVRDWLLTE